MSVWATLGLIFAGFMLNFLFSLAGFWYLSFEYRKRFAALADMMENALKYRDAKLGELKAMLVKDFMVDGPLANSLFDDDPIFSEDEEMEGVAPDEDDQTDAG